MVSLFKWTKCKVFYEVILFPEIERILLLSQKSKSGVSLLSLYSLAY